MAVYQLTPLLLSMIICLTLPSFQSLLNNATEAKLAANMQTTVATALSISSVGLALNSLTACTGSIIILLGILSAPIMNQYAQNSSAKIIISGFMFLLYLRLGVPHA